MTVHPVWNTDVRHQNLLSSECEPQQTPLCSSGLLYRSLPGEYLAMLLAVHTGFLAIGWLCYSPDVATRIAIAAAAVWAMVRVVGIGSELLTTPVITLAFLGASLAVDKTEIEGLPGWLVSGPFSAFMLGCILGFVFALDLWELFELRGQRLAEIVRQQGLRILGYGTVGFIATYSIVVPLLQELVITLSPLDEPILAMDRLTLSQNVVFKFVESVSGLWFLIVGTAVGSFLNVVIYRVPRRISVITQRSHCPSCGVPILASDNLPLVGWLRLNGRCRNCQEEISERYPIVEGIVGLIFLLLFFVELISGGANLPMRSINSYVGVQWILFYTKWDLVGLYAYHCMLLCTVFSWAMIRRDGKRVPVPTSGFMLAITIGAPLLFRHLLPWPYDTVGNQAVTYTVPKAAMTSAWGLLAAGLVSFLPQIMNRACRATLQPPPQFDCPSWLLIGAGLGWQAVVAIVVLLAIWMIGCTFLVPAQDSTHGDPSKEAAMTGQFPIGTELRRLALPCVVLIHQCLWRHIGELFV
ncbi:MAG: prepilin peptidase [Planctomycetaceae bacterium]|nr:prepilin peptidase [Planctomycetaceae bacterium]